MSQIIPSTFISTKLNNVPYMYLSHITEGAILKYLHIEQLKEIRTPLFLNSEAEEHLIPNLFRLYILII